jgi:hypothetical protein
MEPCELIATVSWSVFWLNHNIDSAIDRWKAAKIHDGCSEDTFSWLKDNALSASYQDI